jgi:hypothetical protein
MRELGVQLKHYNGNVRKGALNGLQEIVQKSPGAVVRTGLAQLFASAFVAVNDAEKQVRLALYALLEEVFPIIPDVRMQPFMKLLLAHVCSGMTSLMPELRMSSVIFCDLAVKHFANLMRPYLTDLVPNYADMLGSWTESGVSHHLTSFISQTGDKAAQNMSRAQKKDKKSQQNKDDGGEKARSALWLMLGSLRLFLGSIQDGGENASAKQGAQAAEASTLNMLWSPGSSRVLLNRRAVVAEISPGLFVTQAGDSDAQENEGGFPLVAFARILGLLSDQWVEAFPEDIAALSYEVLKPRFQTLQLLAGVMSTMIEPGNILPSNPSFLRQLQGDYGADWRRRVDQTFSQLTAHFPIAASFFADEKHWSGLFELNLCIAETLIIVSLHYARFDEAKALTVVVKVQEYLSSVLKTMIEKQTQSSSSSEGDHQQQQQSLKDFMPRFLRIVGTILPQLSVERQNEVLQAFTQLFKTCHWRSAAKKSCFYDVIAPTMQQIVERKGVSIDKSLIKEWISFFPQWLWQLGKSDPALSKAMLTVLLRCMQQRTFLKQDSAALGAVFEAMPRLLSPFFTSFPSANANGKSRKNKREKPFVMGPFVKLDEDVQLVATSILFNFDSFPASFLRGVCVAYGAEGVSSYVRHQLLTILSSKFAARDSAQNPQEIVDLEGCKEEFVDFVFRYNFPQHLVDAEWWHSEISTTEKIDALPHKRSKSSKSPSSSKGGRDSVAANVEESFNLNFATATLASLSSPVLSRYLLGLDSSVSVLCFKCITRALEGPMGVTSREQHKRFKVHSSRKVQGWIGAGLLYACISFEKAGSAYREALNAESGAVQQLTQMLVAIFLLNQIDGSSTDESGVAEIPPPQIPRSLQSLLLENNPACLTWKQWARILSTIMTRLLPNCVVGAVLTAFRNILDDCEGDDGSICNRFPPPAAAATTTLTILLPPPLSPCHHQSSSSYISIGNIHPLPRRHHPSPRPTSPPRPPLLTMLSPPPPPPPPPPLTLCRAIRSRTTLALIDFITIGDHKVLGEMKRQRNSLEAIGDTMSAHNMKVYGFPFFLPSFHSSASPKRMPFVPFLQLPSCPPSFLQLSSFSFLLFGPVVQFW